MVSELPSPSMESPDRDHLAELMEKIAAARDKAAFAALYRHFAPRVKAYLLRQGADAAQAEELSQEVMLTVWRKAERFDRRRASVSTWLFTIARNKRIDALRRERPVEFDPADPLLVPAEPAQPDDVLSQAEREARLRAAIEDLPSEQAELLRMAFFSGRSHREIAAETGVPLGTVKSRLRLAFGRLKRALGEEAEDGVEDV